MLESLVLVSSVPQSSQLLSVPQSVAPTQIALPSARRGNARELGGAGKVKDELSIG